MLTGDPGQIIYIGGYGRSGSTLLEILLSDHPDVLGCGEIRIFLRHSQQLQLTCSCGHTYRDCPFWSRVFAAYSEADQATAIADLDFAYRRFEGWLGLFVLAMCGSKSRFHQGYRDKVVRFYETLFQCGKVRTIVESSKTSRRARFRPLMLSRICGLDIRLIHLIRDPRGVYYSMTSRGTNSWLEAERNFLLPRFSAARCLWGWTLANLSCLFHRLILGNSRCLTVRYEDLVSDPIGQLKAIAHFMNIDLSATIQRIESSLPIQPNHIAGGNRVARQGPVRIRSDDVWRREMPRWQQFVVWLLQWPYVRWFGYRIFPNNE